MVSVTASLSGARMEGSKRYDCRDQRCEEDNTTRDNCFDQSHASGLLLWAEGRLWLAALDPFFSGREDLRFGSAFGLGYRASNEVPGPPGDE